MSSNRRVRYDEFDDRFINKSCFNKTRISRENDETKKCQRLNDYLFLNVFDVCFSFQLDINLHF